MSSEKAGLVAYTQNNNTVLNESNYNELDALVFSELSYYSFESAYSDVKVLPLHHLVWNIPFRGLQ